MATPEKASPDTAGFPVTRWSLLLAAQQGDTSMARRALEDICREYWYPLYAYARRRGLTREDAEDLIQEFFRSVVSREAFQTVRPERGRLRSFMLGALKHIMLDGYRRQMTQKRGGGAEVFSIDVAYGEKCLAGEPSHGQSPDVLFDRSWAYSLLESARKRLADWYAGMGKTDLWERMQPCLAGGGEVRTMALELGVNETALRSALHQMRKRYRGLIEEEVRQTVTSSAEAEDELRYLKQVLAGTSL